MNNNILLSVVIPVYQAEKFIETAIVSITRQKASWVEIVLINDGSKDDSGNICVKYEGDNVQYLSIPNSGAGYARNRGIKAARGKWIAFLDSDDMFLSDCLSDELFNRLNFAYSQNVDIIYTGKIECNMLLSDEPVITLPETAENIKNHIPEIEFWSSLYNADFLKKNNICFFEYRKQDIESAFRFRAYSKAKKIYTDENLFFYVHRNNPASNVNTWKIDDMLEVKACVYYQLFEEYKNQNVDVATFLLTQAIYYFKSLLKRYIKLGVDEKSEQRVKNVLNIKNSLTTSVFDCRLSLKYRIFNCILDLLGKRTFCKLFFSLIEKKKRNEYAAEKNFDFSEDNLSEIFTNLDSIAKLMKRS